MHSALLAQSCTPRYEADPKQGLVWQSVCVTLSAQQAKPEGQSAALKHATPPSLPELNQPTPNELLPEPEDPRPLDPLEPLPSIVPSSSAGASMLPASSLRDASTATVP